MNGSFECSKSASDTQHMRRTSQWLNLVHQGSVSADNSVCYRSLQVITFSTLEVPAGDSAVSLFKPPRVLWTWNARALHGAICHFELSCLRKRTVHCIIVFVLSINSEWWISEPVAHQNFRIHLWPGWLVQPGDSGWLWASGKTCSQNKARVLHSTFECSQRWLYTMLTKKHEALF